MNKIEDLFENKKEKISFIEIKENSFVEINGHRIESNVPLPIVTDTLINEIKVGNASEEIKVSHIIEGIIYILGIDYSFKYNNEYKNIIMNYNSKIKDYIFYKGFQRMKDEFYDISLIYFRALLFIDNNNVNALFNYGICLEQQAKKFFDEENVEDGDLFFKEATKVFENILDIDDKFSLAYYKLGYHYRNSGQFLKAKLIWEKFLLLDDDSERKQEIREAIQLIKDDSNYQEGSNLIFCGKYSEALSKLLPITNDCKNSWNLEYMIGLAYKGTGEYVKAIESFEKALKLNPKNQDIYNELSISFFGIGKFNQAIDNFTKGININPQNYKMLCNRGIAYMQLGLYKNAINDINEAYQVNPNDEMVKKLKSQLDDIKDDIL